MADYKIGKGELLWESICKKDGSVAYLITSDSRRDVYYLYHVNKDGTTQRIGKGKNPPDLHKKYLRGG